MMRDHAVPHTMPQAMPRLLMIVTLAAAGALLGGCAGGATRSAPAAKHAASAAGGPVGVSLNEWTIELTAPAANAGTVTFVVRNEGKVPHDLVVVKSDFAAGRLPTASGLVDESKVTIVGRTAELTPGDGKAISVALSEGTYALICNVIGHYNSGQFAAFTVE